VLVDGPALALNPAVVEVDVATFERRIAEGTPEGLEQAAEIYRGDLLLGFDVNEPLFEDWLVAERERLREVALEALARLLAHQSRTKATERAIRTAGRLLGLDPLQEAVHRTLMRLYARQGRRGTALKQYQVCVGMLQRELGAEPEAETKRLYQELLRRPAEAVDAPELRGESRSRRARQAVPTRLDLPEAETPLFGREAELRRLRLLFDETTRGHGHLAAVVGEAGVGKSRFIVEFAAEALRRNVRILLGRCHEGEQILPFGPWCDALRTGRIVGDPALNDLGPVWCNEIKRLLPELGPPRVEPGGPEYLKLCEAVTQLVCRLAVAQPLLLILEDVHWADEMTLALLGFLARRIATAPVFVVATAREEDLVDSPMLRRTLDALDRESHVTRLALRPLTRVHTLTLIRTLARSGTEESEIAGVGERVWRISEGNPFVVAEAMRTLDEGTLPQGSGALSLPERVRGLITRRLDRLSERSQQLAAVAAVIGRDFEFALLQRAAGFDEHEASEGVEELVRRRLLHAVGDRFDFVHDRIRTVAYAQLIRPRRVLLHRQVGEALEALYAGNLDPHAVALGAHYREAEVWDKAVRYFRLAGSHAAARSALPDARVWFEEALSILEALPENQSTLEQAFDIRFELRPVLSQLGEVRPMLERLGEAEALAERLNDDHRRGRVCAFATNVHSLLGDLDEALVTGSRALQIARRFGDSRLRILTTAYLEQAYYYRGEYERVFELALGNLAALPVDWVHEFFGSSQPPSVFDRSWLVMSLAQLGRFAEAAEHEAEAIRLADSTRHAYPVGVAHFAAATLHLLRGDWAKACSLVEHGIAVLRTAYVVLTVPLGIAASAWVLAQLGEAREALSRLREAEQLLERQAVKEILGPRGWPYHSMGRACLLLGRLDEARRLGDRAVESSPRHPGFAAHAQHLLGDIATHPERFHAECGEAHYRQAFALAEPRGMRPLVAHCHFGLGKLYLRTGKGDEAHEHLTTATTMYEEMGMWFWLEQAAIATLGSGYRTSDEFQK
jgi:tetratricopeptide (TPR) repeat protein